MNKVLLHTYWIMWGPYEGKIKPIDIAWFLQAQPPFYHGVGLSIRIGNRSLRFGVCYPRAHVTNHAIDADVIDYTVAWRDHDVDEKEIGSWGSETAPSAAP